MLTSSSIKSVIQCGLSVALLITFVSVGVAQNNWSVISTGGDPDPISTFDLNDPPGTQTGIGFVDGNFNRGMDYFAENSFYFFVSTDSLNDPGDRGLWSWVNGTNTQISTIPFSDSGDGDATFDSFTNQFFVTVDDGDATAGDSLYVFAGLDGIVSFTEVGETTLSQIIGLAIDPTDGTMYAYDSSTEGLYTINPLTGEALLVGFSGETIAAIGGMDFSADGSLLVLSSGDDIFTVDKTTGLLTAAGTLSGLNTSALAFNAVAVIPEPSTFALLALSSIALIRRRKR